MTQYLSSLFESPPYLWVNGQRHDYAPSQVICISATAPAHLHSEPQSVSFNANIYADKCINRALASDVFETVPQPHDQLCNITTILVRRTGVCRHRSWVFLAFSGYVQVESRIVGNNIHNIIELNDYHGGTQNYVKAEISEFGFRRINFDFDALSKNRINEIRDNYIIGRRVPRPTPTGPVDPNDPDSITELEALILSPHLGPNTRQRELTYFCEHMLNCGRLPSATVGLDPESIRFEIPTEFDDKVVEIISKAALEWGNTTLFYRGRWGEAAKTIQFFSNHLSLRNELQHPIAHFYAQLLQNLESKTQSVLTEGATNPTIWDQFVTDYSPGSQMYNLPIVKTYIDTMLSKRIPYDKNRGFKEHSVCNIVLADEASQSLLSPRTEQYSWTKGTSIDYQRYIGGKPFLKCTRSQIGPRPQVVITKSLSSYFSDKQKSQYKEGHLIECAASELWRQFGKNITIATFWGTETPKTFADFSKIIEFLENHSYAAPLRLEEVFRRYTGSLRLIPTKVS